MQFTDIQQRKTGVDILTKIKSLKPNFVKEANCNKNNY